MYNTESQDCCCDIEHITLYGLHTLWDIDVAHQNKVGYTKIHVAWCDVVKKFWCYQSRTPVGYTIGKCMLSVNFYVHTVVLFI